MAQETNISI